MHSCLHRLHRDHLSKNEIGLDLDLSRAVSANMGRIRSHSPRLVGGWRTDEGQGLSPSSVSVQTSPDHPFQSPPAQLENGLADNNRAHCSYSDTLTVVVLTRELLVWRRANKTRGLAPNKRRDLGKNSDVPFPISPLTAALGEKPPKPFFGLAGNVR